MGESSLYLAEHLRVKVIGITISPVQQKIAERAARERELNLQTKFLTMDAENMMFSEKFDYIWSIEAISHFPNKDKFFKDAVGLLNSGGRVVLIDWFMAENLSEKENKKFIDPIRKGMLVPDISTIQRYKTILENNNCKIISVGNISTETAKTWDISLDIIKNPKFWILALLHGKRFVDFLQAFKAMRNGFSSGTFVYGFIVAEKK